MSFKEQLEALKKSVDDMITNETPTDQVKKLGEFKDSLDQLGQTHQITVDDYGELKNLYINAVKGTGTKAKPVDEVSPDSNLSDEQLLEKMGREIISNRGK